jgi:hypothetical protein
MKFLTAIQFLSTVFLTFVVGDEVMAAQPFRFAKFTIAASDIPVPGACQDYNNQVANGVDVNHPNYCQFSNVQITFNGLPFDQYWQAVSSGSVPPPYHVTYNSQQRRGVCASTAGVEGIVEVSMKFPTSRLVWSGAASVGRACNAEWGRHIKLTQASDLTDLNTATMKVQGLVSTLNSKAATHFKSCAEVPRPGVSVQREAFVGLAAAIKNFMSNDVNSAQTSWSPHEVSGQACRLHCNVCSSGWAGTLTCTQQGTGKDNAGNPANYTETQNWYVGETSGTTIKIITADWTAVGGGSCCKGGTWTTNNATTGLQFRMLTDLTTGNVTIKRYTNGYYVDPPSGIVGSGGASPATDYEVPLPPIQTQASTDTTIPIQWPNQPLPYTSANNGPMIAQPSGTFICQGALNLQ